MPQVVSLKTYRELEARFNALLLRVDKLEARLPDWIRDAEACQLTGVASRTLARERDNPNTLLVFKTTGGVRYLRSSVEAYNEARTINRSRYLRRELAAKARQQ
jgi:hypothetical protein